MKPYTREDLHVLDDPIAFLRKRPDTYAGGRPWGPRFAARLAHDLVLLSNLPIHIERIDSWWVVSSEKDWLVTADGAVSTKPFFHIVAFPAAGDNSHRSEVLLTAFADVVVTCGVDGLTWIRPDARCPPLSDGVRGACSRIGRGRLVAFQIEE
jgi:hypothetical protein